MISVNSIDMSGHRSEKSILIMVCGGNIQGKIMQICHASFLNIFVKYIFAKIKPHTLLFFLDLNGVMKFPLLYLLTNFINYKL